MFNKNNQQNHYGVGNQIIDQSTHITANFYGYSDTPSGNNGDEKFFPFLFGAVLFVLLVFLNTIRNIIQNYQWIILGMFILLLIISAIYVYKKSKNKNYVYVNIAQYSLNILSTYFAINFKLPDKLQKFLSSLQANIDTSSTKKITETILKFITSFNQDYQIKITALIYLLILIVTLLSIFSITINVFFKKTIRDYSLGFVFTFWFIFFILINL